MIQYETKDTLDVGDFVAVTLHSPIVHTAYYRAKRMTNKRPCSLQCDLHNGVRCNGYCYRYKNDDICFTAIEQPDNCIIVETEFGKACRGMETIDKQPNT